MTKDPVTIETDTRIHQAQKIMRQNKIRKLPVVKDGKLVGMVTRDMLLEVSPSKATGLSIQEIHYILAEMTVKDVMDKNPATVSPDMPFEEALKLGQQKGNAGFPVVENGKLVGIITNGDVIRLLTAFLGLGEDGSRITIEQLGRRLGELREIIAILDGHSAPILSIMTKSESISRELMVVIRLKVNDATAIVEDLRTAGFKVSYMSNPFPEKAL
jgi:acetoin utilization protein AcuB